MIENRRDEAGFTAVELLITLFVAAAFLVAGYQLFNVVIKDGGAARAESRAGNIAYDYMRRYSTSATIPCSPSAPLTQSPVTVDSLADTKVSVLITCPPFSTTGVSEVEVTVTYNQPTQTVKFSTFVNGSSPQTADVTNNLIAWWKFNNTGSTLINEVGTGNTTAFNMPLTTGQNGVANNAHSFNGSGQFAQFSKNFIRPSLNFTVSVWALRTRNNAAEEELLSQWSNSSPSQNFFFGFANSNVRFGDSWPSIGVTGAGNTGVWMHLVGVNDVTNNNAYIYLNGALAAAKGSPLNINGQQNFVIGRQGEYAGGAEYFQGSMDDVRIYDRALSSTEVQTLYNRGAQ